MMKQISTPAPGQHLSSGETSKIALSVQRVLNCSAKGRLQVGDTTIKMNLLQATLFGAFRGPLSLLCVFLLVSNSPVGYAQAPQAEAPKAEAPKIPNDQLDSLVAPIALFPDPLLAQMLAASTYPLEIVQLQQWLAQHKDLKDKALADAVQKQDWDPRVLLRSCTLSITWSRRSIGRKLGYTAIPNSLVMKRA